MKNFLRIMRFGRPYGRYALMNGVFNLLATVFHLASMLLFIPFLRLLLGQTKAVYEKPVLAWDKASLEQGFFFYPLLFLLFLLNRLDGYTIQFFHLMS